MGEPAKRATYEDLYAVPENMIGEIIDGELVVAPRPSPEHAAVASVLGGELVPTYYSGRGGGPGGWIILYQPEVMFFPRGEPLVPDLAGWKKERFRRSKEHNWVDVAPNWVCEVLSPSAAGKDRFTKMSIYGEHLELQHVWLVDPAHKTLEVFGRQQSRAWIILGYCAKDDKVRAEPFPEAETALGGLWLE